MANVYFGGSFNPLHNGHLVVARAVAERGKFDHIVLVPAALPPHKPRAADLASADQRLAMCQLVANGDPLFAVSDIEVARGGASYTIDTVARLRQVENGAVHWLIGADMLLYLPKWKEVDRLMLQVNFWVARRPGFVIEWNHLPASFATLKSRIVDTPLLEISSTNIRQRVREGQSIRYLVPEPIERYIADQRMYRT